MTYIDIARRKKGYDLTLRWEERSSVPEWLEIHWQGVTIPGWFKKEAISMGSMWRLNGGYSGDRVWMRLRFHDLETAEEFATWYRMRHA